MVAIISALLTLVVAMLVTKIGAVALTLTGIAQEEALFEARSAYFGVGFTSAQSEKVVRHPVRRNIIMLLMFAGHLGVSAMMAAILGSILTIGRTSESWVLGLVPILLFLIWFIATSPWFDRRLTIVVEWLLLRMTSLDVRDYVSLLHLAEGYVVMELNVRANDWLANQSLSELQLTKEGVLVLGILRDDGRYIGSPAGSTRLFAGDVLSLYGPIDRLEEIDLRGRGLMGDKAHRIAVSIQQDIDNEQLKEAKDQ